MIVVAGDVGGTKSLLCAARLAPAAGANGAPEILLERRYSSHAYPEFSALLEEFLGLLDEPARCAAIGVAGPVMDGRCRATNLPWTLDQAALEGGLGLPRVRLVNDFVAAARGVLALRPADVVTLQPGRPDPAGAIAVLGAGTGFGQAVLTPHGGRYYVVSSEGGNADFAPRTDEEIELLRFLRDQFGHVSYESVVSGPGIANLYRFARARGRHPESPAVAAAIAAGDPAAAIAGFDGPAGDPLCREALDLFVSVYGAEAGNLALRAVSTGGVYIAGGIAPRMVARFQDGRFMDAFLAKGRYRPLLERVPVHLVTDTRVGLRGALALAADLADEGGVSR